MVRLTARLQYFMAQRGIEHPSDGLAEWLIDNGFVVPRFRSG